MRMKTKKLLQRGQDLVQRAEVSFDTTGPTITFGSSARKILDDLFIDFQSRWVLYAEGEFEIPDRVEHSLQEMRGLCVHARQQLAGEDPLLGEPLDRIAQACGRFVIRHPAIREAVDFSKPLAANVLDDLLELRLEVATAVEEVYRLTDLPSAQRLFNRIEFRREITSPWPGW
jgi:hypothetical protein